MGMGFKQCGVCLNNAEEIEYICTSCDGLNHLRKNEELINRDMVNHPPHYQSNGLEVIKVIEAFTADCSGVEATDTGNIIKYICRWKNKNGIEDLKKAKWYLNHLIKYVEEENNKNEEL